MRRRYQFGRVERKARKRGPDVWVFRYVDRSSGKPIYRSVEIGSVKKYAKISEALKAAEPLRIRANPDNPAGKRITFGGLLDLYEKELPERFSTSYTYKANIQAHIRPKWGDYTLEDIKPFAVETWLDSLPLAPKTRGHLKTIIVNAFNCALRWEFIPGHQLKLVRVPGVSKRKSKALVLTAEQVADLVAAIEQEPFKTMAWLSACLGLEPSVLIGLKWEDVDLDRGEVTIRRGVVCNHEGPAKNEYREGRLPLDETLAKMLTQWQKETPWKAPGDWVWASPYFMGKKPYSPRHVAEDHFWPAAQKAGLGQKIGWKTFRRTYSSLLRQLGVDLKVQQSLLRHADIRTTMNLYTDSYTGDMRAAHSKVVQALVQ